jgi:HrpA-like RNA helicase
MKMEGNRIVFMTEEMFINSCIRPCFWDEISAVIVDEAHERNLYTDIVLGLCKH